MFASIKQAESLFTSLNLPVSKARAILIKANYFFDNQEQHKDDFIDCLEDLMFAKEVYMMNLFYQHCAKCLILISIIYLELDKLEESKFFVSQAIS